MNKRVFDRNLPYNDLPLLPPPKEVENDPEVLKKLILATRALASVNNNILRLPNPLMLINTIALQEAKTSTEIENIFTTDDELYKAISETTNEERANPATKEVLRYREALWAGYLSMQTRNFLDLGSIISIVQQIKNTSSGIRPPQARVTIKRGQSEFRTGEVIYTPPRGLGVIETLLNNMVDYLNDDINHPADPLFKMCIAHYQFEAIHPFQDGNGRTGRIINLLYLVQSGLLIQPALYLSKYIIVNKDDYYYILSAVTQRGAWKGWIMYMLDAVEKTSHLTNNLITEILDQMESTLEYGKSKIKWYSKEVNESIFSQPYIRAKTIGAVMGKTSRTTQTKQMGELQKAKILSAKREGSEVFYLNEDLIRILKGE